MPISAVEAISPAMELTKQRMFRPARYSQWWRIALIGLLAGEFSGGGFNFSVPTLPPQHKDKLLSAATPELSAIVTVAVLCFLVAMLIMLAFLYIASVMRFQLLDATLRGQYQVIDGWRFWRHRAIPFFRLNLWLMLASFVGLAVFAGAPLAFIYSLTGGFKQWNNAAILPILCGAVLLIAYFIALAVVSVFSKDFVVPMIALEGLGYREAWQRLGSMISANRKDYAIYILMKIVVAIGGSVLGGIVAIALLLILGIPLGIAGFVVWILFSAALKGTLGIALLVAAAIIFGLIWGIAVTVLCAPVAMFYMAFSLIFFAHRYPPLWNVMFPPPQAPPEVPPAPMDPAPAF